MLRTSPSTFFYFLGTFPSLHFCLKSTISNLFAPLLLALDKRGPSYCPLLLWLTGMLVNGCLKQLVHESHLLSTIIWMFEEAFSTSLTFFLYKPPTLQFSNWLLCWQDGLDRDFDLPGGLLFIWWMATHQADQSLYIDHPYKLLGKLLKSAWFVATFHAIHGSWKYCGGKPS